MKQYLSLFILCALFFSGCTLQDKLMSKVSLPSKLTPSQTNTQKNTGKSLKDLINSGIAQKCTWKYSENNEDIEGTMLISGKKFRQEVNFKTADVPSVSSKNYIISDGEFVYMWNSQMTKGDGLKIRITDPEKKETEQSDNFNWERKFDYQCKPSVISNDDLSPPKDIVFEDIQTRIKELQQGTVNNLQNQLELTTPTPIFQNPQE